MRPRVLASVLSLCFSVCLASALAAATIQGVIPAQAPHGARVVITGTGLDDPRIAVTFSGVGGDVPAAIVSRTATEIEVRVPETAITGPIRAGNTSAAFTVGADPGFANVVTLAASDAAHDLLKQPSGAAIDPRWARSRRQQVPPAPARADPVRDQGKRPLLPPACGRCTSPSAVARSYGANRARAETFRDLMTRFPFSLSVTNRIRIVIKIASYRHLRDACETCYVSRMILEAEPDIEAVGGAPHPGRRPRLRVQPDHAGQLSP